MFSSEVEVDSMKIVKKGCPPVGHLISEELRKTLYQSVDVFFDGLETQTEGSKISFHFTQGDIG